MPSKKQDSTNSKREWGVGGYGFENPFGLVASNDSLHIGFSNTYSYLIQSGESGWGHFGVGMNPFIDYGQKWYNTIVSDGVIEKSSKFNFYSTLEVKNIPYQWGPPWGLSVSTTYIGRFLRAQYYESHLITGSVSFLNSQSRVYFTEFPQRDGTFRVPNCEARAYRLLATVNGIERTSITQSRSFSAYWDITFGIKNFEFCPGGSSMDFIGGSYLNQVYKTSFLSTGTIGLTSTTPNLQVETLGGGLYTISAFISGTYNVIGSAKLTTVDSGSLVTTYTEPV